MGVLKPDREGEGARGSWIQVPLIRGFPNTAGQGGWWMEMWEGSLEGKI